MLPFIRKPKRKQKKDKEVEDLFQEYEETIPKTKEDFNYEILQNLEPVHVDGIYNQKKLIKSIKIDTNNTPKNCNKNHQRNQSMKDLNSFRDQPSLVQQNVSSPKAINLQPFNQPTFLNNITENSPRQRGISIQRAQFKSKSQHIIQVDQIDETDQYEDLNKKKKNLLLDDENEESDNLPPQIQKEITKKWGEVNVSIKKCSRSIQQGVSKTMKTISSNFKQIVHEQENNRIIRNLTSLDSIFQSARSECIDMKLIDLTSDKDKKTKSLFHPNKILHTSITQLPTIHKATTLETDENIQEQEQTSMKFKKINDSNPNFSYMYSRFIKKLSSQLSLKEGLVQKYKGKTFHQKSYNYNPKINNTIPYQPLTGLLTESAYLQKKDISIITNDKNKEQFSNLPILEANMNNRAKYIQQNEQMFNNSNQLDKSKLSTTINNSSHMNKTISTHGESTQSKQTKFSPLKSNKTLLKSESTRHVKKNKSVQLPNCLIPFKNLVLNTWKDKIGPTPEENILLSNCLGMLSLHTEMTEGVHDIKDFKFNKDSVYRVVPSKSSRQQKNAEKKFTNAIKSNQDFKQMLININIQQLDQVVEIEDPVDYLVSDKY